MLKVTNHLGITFNVRIVRKGDTYGLNGFYTHDKERNLVEFYDTRYDHTEYGQFVARYYEDTLLDRDNGGMWLDYSIASWTVTADNMKEVRDYIKNDGGMKMKDTTQAVEVTTDLINYMLDEGYELDELGVGMKFIKGESIIETYGQLEKALEGHNFDRVLVRPLEHVRKDSILV